MFQVNPLPRQRIHMKNQPLYSLKDKSKKLKCRLLQFLSSHSKWTGEGQVVRWGWATFQCRGQSSRKSVRVYRTESYKMIKMYLKIQDIFNQTE